MPENPAPEGRTSLAQRGSAGKSGANDSSPGGTTGFSLTHFSRAVTIPRKIGGFSPEVTDFHTGGRDLINGLLTAHSSNRDE